LNALALNAEGAAALGRQLRLLAQVEAELAAIDPH
jgi:hypothetical protein